MLFLRTYVRLSEDEYLMVAPWILHTHTFAAGPHPVSARKQRYAGVREDAAARTARAAGSQSAAHYGSVGQLRWQEPSSKTILSCCSTKSINF